MRRRAWWILGTLVGAAILNIAVALACAAGPGPAVFDPQLTARLRRSQFEAADVGRDDEPWIESACRATGVEVVFLRPAAGPRTRSHRSGWPLRALEGRALDALGAGADPVGHRWAVEASGELQLEYSIVSGKPKVVSVRRIMPLRPMWPGFALNTLIFAAAVPACLTLARTSQRVLRRLRGRCTRCGYDLRGEPGGGCPECGWRRPRTIDA